MSVKESWNKGRVCLFLYCQQHLHVSSCTSSRMGEELQYCCLTALRRDRRSSIHIGLWVHLNSLGELPRDQYACSWLIRRCDLWSVLIGSVSAGGKEQKWRSQLATTTDICSILRLQTMKHFYSM